MEIHALLVVENGTERLLDANAAASRLYGFTRAEFLQLTANAIRASPAADRSVTSAGGTQVSTDRHRKKDGTVFTVEIATREVATGGRSERLIAIQDITERKEAESERRKLSRAIEQSPIVVMITDATGKIEYVNPSFTTTTGYSLAEVQGKTPRLLKSGEQLPDFYRRLWQEISQGREWRGEFHNRKKNGELFWEAAIISPIHDENGRCTHFLAVKQDVTAQKALEMQLRHMQKMDAVGQLAGGIAHDFNNILAATMLHLNLLQKEPRLSTPLRASLNELELEVRRAASLTRQLLLFSRRQIMRVEPVDLNELVANLIKMLRRLIGENIRLAFPGVAHPLWIDADAGMIEQVLMNLCVNARDAMPNGGTLAIETHLVEVDEATAALNPEARAGSMAMLEISDTGCGMDAATVKRLFEPFFTTKYADKGAGLGLATAYGIVRQHRGWMTVDSEIGQGTTFRIYLPNRHIPSPGPAEDPQPARGSEVILLVEDDQEMRRMTALTLESYGYRVLQAADGKQAIETWREHSDEIHLLLTDMVMPTELTGLKLAEQLRASRATLPVLITSGYSTTLNHNADLPGKGIGYLPKPFPAETLAAAVRGSLDRSKNGR